MSSKIEETVLRDFADPLKRMAIGGPLPSVLMVRSSKDPLYFPCELRLLDYKRRLLDTSAKALNKLVMQNVATEKDEFREQERRAGMEDAKRKKYKFREKSWDCYELCKFIKKRLGCTLAALTRNPHKLEGGSIDFVNKLVGRTLSREDALTAARSLLLILEIRNGFSHRDLDSGAYLTLAQFHQECEATAEFFRIVADSNEKSQLMYLVILEMREQAIAHDRSRRLREHVLMKEASIIANSLLPSAGKVPASTGGGDPTSLSPALSPASDGTEQLLKEFKDEDLELASNSNDVKAQLSAAAEELPVLMTALLGKMLETPSGKRAVGYIGSTCTSKGKQQIDALELWLPVESEAVRSLLATDPSITLEKDPIRFKYLVDVLDVPSSAGGSGGKGKVKGSTIAAGLKSGSSGARSPAPLSTTVSPTFLPYPVKLGDDSVVPLPPGLYMKVYANLTKLVVTKKAFATECLHCLAVAELRVNLPKYRSEYLLDVKRMLDPQLPLSVTGGDSDE